MSIELLLGIKGIQFDRDRAILHELLYEIFPDTTRTASESSYGLLDWWENLLDITPAGGATPTQRRAAICAQLIATGGFNRDYYYGIARSLGYLIGTHAEVGDPHLRITEGDFVPAMTGYAQTGLSLIWDQDIGASRYTWCVRGTLVESDTVLQNFMDRFRAIGTEVIFINE